MDTDTITSSNLLRLVGIMAIGIGAAWALQILGFGGDNTAFGRMLWVVSAAAMAGSGAGLLIAANGLSNAEGTRSEARGRA